MRSSLRQTKSDVRGQSTDSAGARRLGEGEYSRGLLLGADECSSEGLGGALIAGRDTVSSHHVAGAVVSAFTSLLQHAFGLGHSQDRKAVLQPRASHWCLIFIGLPQGVEFTNHLKPLESWIEQWSLFLCQLMAEIN